MQINFWAATDTGLTRNHNEDNFLVDRKLNLFIVADGMGGHAAGEVASSVAVHEVRKVLTEQREVIDSYAYSGSVLRRQPVLSLIEKAISQACHQVYRYAQEDSERHGMGTTLSMLLLINGRGFVGHVGDSRIYMTRDNKARQVTEDHSVINELIKSGRLSPEEAHNSPYKNAVTRAVGVHANVEVDTFDFEVKPGDDYLLCSDGLCGYFDHEDEIKPFMADEDLKAIPQRLIDYANGCGGKDNITAIVVRVSGEQSQAPLFDPPSLPLTSHPSTAHPSTAHPSTAQGLVAQGLAAQGSPLTQPPPVSAHAGLTTPGHEPLTAPPPLTRHELGEAREQAASEVTGGLKGSLKGLKPVSSPTPRAPITAPSELSQLPLEHLKLSPLFACLQHEAIEELAHYAEVERFGPGEVISVEGDEEERLMALLSGEVALERGAERVGSLVPGDLLGEERLLTRSPNTMSAISESHCVLLSWRRPALYHMMTLNPALGLRVMWGAAQLAQLRLKSLEGRLERAKALIDHEVTQHPELSHLVSALSLSDLTASALVAHTTHELTPAFILDLDEPPLPLFKTPLSDATTTDHLDALEDEQELFTSDALKAEALTRSEERSQVSSQVSSQAQAPRER